MKNLILILALVAISACSSLKKPEIEVKNNLIYHDGFELAYTNFKHKFTLDVKPEKDYIISRINYKFNIPNHKGIWGTYIPQKILFIRQNQVFHQIQILSEETSYFDLCEQMNAIFKTNDPNLSMKLDLEFITSENKTIIINNIDLSVKNTNLWDSIRNFLVENGCKVTTLPGFVNLIKTLIGG